MTTWIFLNVIYIYRDASAFLYSHGNSNQTPKYIRASRYCTNFYLLPPVSKVIPYGYDETRKGVRIDGHVFEGRKSGVLVSHHQVRIRIAELHHIIVHSSLSTLCTCIVKGSIIIVSMGRGHRGDFPPTYIGFSRLSGNISYKVNEGKIHYLVLFLLRSITTIHYTSMLRVSVNGRSMLV